MDSGGSRPDGTVSTGSVGRAATVDGSELTPGTMVGEYRVVGPLGTGGMGRVYSAEHPVIAKKAAIKVLHPELSVNKAAVDRFVQEARSVNQIGHPNIVDIFSFGTLPDGRNYFVMEWLRGESLRDRIKRARLSLADALVILETITLPLEAAHEHGIVHRDLKPDNVFLVDIKDERPQVKLLDFGIAKLMGTQSLQRTQTGNMLGTPAYMSPEQARGEGVDYRTDIYALGAMAFELLTGEMAFTASNAADMIAQHLFQPPRSVRAINPSVPPGLDALVVEMLAKEADARPSLDRIRNELRAMRLMLPHIPQTPPRGVESRSFGGQPTPPAQMPYATPIPSHLGGAVAAAPTLSASTAMPRAKRSRLPLILASLLVVGGAAVGGVVWMQTRRSVETKPAEQAESGVQAQPAPTPPSEPVAAPSHVEAPVAPAEQAVAPVETKPVETKPVETKPVETNPVATKPVDTKPTAPKHASTKRDGKKHAAQNSNTAKGSAATTTKPERGSAATPFDPDAPM